MTGSDLIAVWERGDGQRTAGRGLALLAAAEPTLDAEERASLPVGRRDASLLALRERLFGPHFSGTTTCPACREPMELTFDASDVHRETPGLAPLVVDLDGFAVKLRLPDSRDLLAIERTRDLAAARELLLTRCTVGATRNGAACDPGEIPAAVLARIPATLGAADPQADVELELSCPSCGHAWREPFDIVSFFWTEVAAQAQRLLAEVHLLASAYGWNERAILRLSAARRRTYLELVR
jgi:hypothetical protein